MRATAPEDANMPMPRAMVVMAHPDDETIALGGRMGRFQEAHFVHVTDGAPRNEQDSRAHSFAVLADYRKAREHELMEMFSRAGLSRVSHNFLNVPDQEASLHLDEITYDVAQHIAHHEPEVIFTHPFEGGHPDHDASAFAVHHAIAMHDSERAKAPVIIEAPFYHSGPNGFESGLFVDSDQDLPQVVYELSAAERTRKHTLMDCFVTQKETLTGFDDTSERYRIAPKYDFTQPPHTGKVLYDHYPWGMTSERFCKLAEVAEAELRKEAAGGR